MLIGLDTETTGLDPWHGTMPFLVTVSVNGEDQIIWEWDVDPYTRKPSPDLNDLVEIQNLIDSADSIVLQNSTFDIKMLDTLNGYEGWEWNPWPWDRIHDTQISAHMLASCGPRDLTNLSLIYLGVDLQPFEDRIHLATEKARRIARSKLFKETYGEWRQAKAGEPDMPSAVGKCWKADMWLPRTICQLAEEFLPDWESWKAPTKKEKGDDPSEHPWWDILHGYANSDSEATLNLHRIHMQRLAELGQMEIYEERRKILRIVYDMKETGVSVNARRKDELHRKYEEEAEKLRKKCIVIANNPELEDLPVNGRSNALNVVVFEQFKLTSPFVTPTGNPSMNKDAIEYWLEQLSPSDKRRLFLASLLDYRKRKTAISYMDGYERFWVPVDGDDYVLHPSLHATGTNTLRWSSSNPNEQNISKKEGFNLRYCFGPRQGRVWASLDYENIELRIPAYESGEAELIDLFERPDEPPYYGSVHMLNFSTVFPDKWAEAVRNGGVDGASDWIKKHWKSTWYQRCKNGDFAVQYGSVERGGGRWSTADRAFGRKGCQALLKARFSKQEALNNYWIRVANETGYVSTMPDKEVNTEQGYPIQCSRAASGDISPTVPLNYHVQGTACWVIMKAMLKVQEYLDKINKGKPLELQAHMVMQVHDELVLDFPLRKGYEIHLRKVREIMESCGECIGVPLKVGCEVHMNNWAEGQPL